MCLSKNDNLYQILDFLDRLIFLLLIKSDFLSLHGGSIKSIYSKGPGNCLKRCIPGQSMKCIIKQYCFITLGQTQDSEWFCLSQIAQPHYLMIKSWLIACILL